MYERFIEELKLYSRAIRVLLKGYLPISLLPLSKLEKLLNEVRIAIAKSNKDYDLVLTRLYLYYDMKLVTFGMLCTCKTQWYIMGMLIIITLGILYLVTNKIRKTSFCKGHLFSNNTKILLFISNAHSYVPIKIVQSTWKYTLILNKRKIKPRKCET